MEPDFAQKLAFFYIRAASARAAEIATCPSTVITRTTPDRPTVLQLGSGRVSGQKAVLEASTNPDHLNWVDSEFLVRR
ncbi:MAG: hypothetical protein UU09_C0038G0004 [Microgenomates group bacterium GW2011_GWA2_40_6]|nr:MAG: hypothetical protein UU09_C0038G0004 [Microgenomates group bacterium GW2011_GWA2_40_6]